MALKEQLSKFREYTDEKELTSSFEELSKEFLYGGYLDIRGEYRVYVRTVEFYYHSEKPDGIHDPIVYHRNGRDLESVPYFPLMYLNAHQSGFDITFENSESKYRASALIRSYEVKDKDGRYLKWEKVDSLDRYMFMVHDDYQYNKQPTYLYTILNGFSIDGSNDIKWKEDRRPIGLPEKSVRQNVYKSVNASEYKPFIEEDGKYVRCDRLWSFTRKEQV